MSRLNAVAPGLQEKNSSLSIGKQNGKFRLFSNFLKQGKPGVKSADDVVIVW